MLAVWAEIDRIDAALYPAGAGHINAAQGEVILRKLMWDLLKDRDAHERNHEAA
jgi:hypothetical protein